MKPKIISIIGIIILFACNNQLEITPKGVLTDANVFTNASDIKLAIDAAYLPLTDRFRGQWDWGDGGAIPRDWVIGDVMSDDAVKAGGSLGDQEDMRKLQTFQIFPDNDNVLATWRYNYQGIAAANTVITMPEVPGADPQLVKNAQGEAHFLRGYYYFRLVMNFGGVPLLIPEENKMNPDQRNTVDEVYAQIASDLMKSVDLLPESWDAENYQRATQGAAYALMAKTFIFQKKWTEALDAIAKVEALGYGLLPNYADNFNGQGEMGSEIIFAARHDAGRNPMAGSILNVVFAPRGEPGGWGFNEPTADFVAEFEPDDARLHTTVALDGEELWPGLIYKSTFSIFTGYNLKKTLVNVSPQDDGYVDFPLIRFADVLLWKAEANAELGNANEALATLEKVRTRARALANDPATALPMVNTTVKEELLNAIRHERRVELGFEGHRYYDLVRWGLAQQVLQPTAQTDPLKGIGDYGLGWKENDKLLPIPQREIDLLGLEQNVGY